MRRSLCRVTGSNGIFTLGSNCMSTSNYARNCTFTLVYMVAVLGVDVSCLEKDTYMVYNIRFPISVGHPDFCVLKESLVVTPFDILARACQ